MHISIWILPALLLAGLSSGCRRQAVSGKQLVDIIHRDKRLSETKEVNGITIKMDYVPYQLMVLQELEGAAKKDTATLGRLERKYRTHLYFRLSFSKNRKEVIRQVSSFHQYSDLLQVFSFEMGGHIDLTTAAGDTLYLQDYAFTQDYGMSKANESMLVFDRKAFDRSQELQVNIGEFGLGTGDLNFVFRKEDIDHLPTLKYSGVN